MLLKGNKKNPPSPLPISQLFMFEIWKEEWKGPFFFYIPCAYKIP